MSTGDWFFAEHSGYAAAHPRGPWFPSLTEETQFYKDADRIQFCLRILYNTHHFENTVTIFLLQQRPVFNMPLTEIEGRETEILHTHSAAVPSKPLQQLGKHVNTMKIHHLATGNSSFN